MSLASRTPCDQAVAVGTAVLAAAHLVAAGWMLLAPGSFVHEIGTTGGGASSLRYDSKTGQFVYNWKTPRRSGACYAVTATTRDGSSITALFRLR